MKRSVFVILSILLLTMGAYALVQDRDEVKELVEVLGIEPGDVIADVGAGDGKWAVAVAEVVGGNGRVYATEVDKDDLKKIRDRVKREKAENVTVVEGTQSSTGLDASCCDAILLRRVYHHFHDPEVMQDALRAALKPNGRLLVIDFEARRRWDRPNGIPESRDGHGISKEMLVEEMETAGFELLDDRDWANNDYALVFRVAVID